MLLRVPNSSLRRFISAVSAEIQFRYLHVIETDSDTVRKNDHLDLAF